MLKLTLLVLLVALLNAHSYTLEQIMTSVQDPPPARNCTVTVYVKDGEACDNAKNIRCKSFHACRNGNCAPGYIGSECRIASDCAFSDSRTLNVRCVNNKCIKPKYNGYECESNEECFGGTCTNKICSGSAENVACDPNALVSCEKGLYCSLKDRVCKKSLDFGSKCNDFGGDYDYLPEGANYFVMCKGGLKCMGPANNKVCISYKSGSVNSPCNYERDGDDECQFGLYCHPKHNQCLKEQEYPTFLCKGSNRQCVKSDLEGCICENGDPNVGTCRSIASFTKCDYFENMNRYRICLEQNHCPFERNFLFSMFVNVFEKTTCSGKNCGGLVKDFLCCSMRDYSNSGYSFAEVDPLGCGPVGSDSSSVGPFIAVIFVLFLLFVGVGIAGGIGAAVFLYIRKTADPGFQELP